jgi:hypothetical protein
MSPSARRHYHLFSPSLSVFACIHARIPVRQTFYYFTTVRRRSEQALHSYTLIAQAAQNGRSACDSAASSENEPGTGVTTLGCACGAAGGDARNSRIGANDDNGCAGTGACSASESGGSRKRLRNAGFSWAGNDRNCSLAIVDDVEDGDSAGSVGAGGGGGGAVGCSTAIGFQPAFDTRSDVMRALR